MPLDSAMFLFAGFLEMEPHPDGGGTAPAWGDHVISADKFTLVWHYVRIDFFFDEGVADEYTPFEWFQRASSFRNKLSVTERTVRYSDLVKLPTPVTMSLSRGAGAAAGVAATVSVAAGAAPATTPPVSVALDVGAARTAAALLVSSSSSGATPVSSSGLP